MTPQQKSLVRETWAIVKPISKTAAKLFYGRLFEQYPEVKPYFKGDMEQQGEKLMAMIDTAVEGLDNLEVLLQPLKEMGARHVDYGVMDEDYDKVATALLWTLEQGLGPAFTPQAREAWSLTYTAVADAMRLGTKG